MNKEIITISMSNTKMGAVPSFSLMPIITCSPDAPCRIKGCYMKPLVASRIQLRQSLSKNTDIATSDPEKVYRQVCGWLAMYRPVAFRIHVSGDFFNTEYLDVWNRIARRNSSVKFFAFTKQFGVLRGYLSKHKLSKNLSIILSAWLPGTEVWLPPADLRKRFPVAWIIDKKKKLLPAEARFNNGVNYCQDNCETCGLCFNRKRKDGDIVFIKH